MNINEIASLAGVSRATVSRYLNDGYVSQDKKERIQKVIDETGYQPSTYAKTLRSKKTNLVGVIIPKINSESISRIIAGISKILSANGYQLLLACTENTENKELEYLSIFRDNHVDGIILLGTIFTPEHIKALEQLTVPIVIVGQNLANYSCVYHNDYAGAYELTASLIPNGKQFGYLCADTKDIAVGKNRLEGFTNAMKDANISKDHYFVGDIMNTGFTIDSGYQQAKELLEKHPDIDTFVCATDTLALGSMKYIREQGIEIPGQIQIAGMNDSAVSRVTYPMLSSVHFYFEEAGEEAAKALCELIATKNDGGHKSLQLGYEVLLHESSR